MSGGPTTPALVLAAAEAGSAGSLAGGYQTAEALAEQVAEVRATHRAVRRQPVLAQPGAGRPGGVRRLPRAAAPAGRVVRRRPAGRRRSRTTTAGRTRSTCWSRRRRRWCRSRSGCPSPRRPSALGSAGCTLVQTVTSADEALPGGRGRDGRADRAVARRRRSLGHLHPGAAARAAPAPRPGPRRAGGHRPPGHGRGWDRHQRPTSPPRWRPAPRPSRSAPCSCSRPRPAPTRPTGPASPRTAATRSRPRAFSGRPAGGLPNAFLAAYDGRGPLGYPALHHLTSPIRRAAAARRRTRARQPLGRHRPPPRRRRGRPGRSCGRWSPRSPSSGSCRGRRSDRRAAPSGARW